MASAPASSFITSVLEQTNSKQRAGFSFTTLQAKQRDFSWPNCTGLLADQTMDLKESALLRERAAQHWYYRSKAEFVAKLLHGTHSRRLLDVGAGSGFFTRWLMSRGSVQEAWCVDTNYDSDAEEYGQNGTIHFRRSLSPVCADLVLLMDVLEHVDDDVGLLRDALGMVTGEPTFLISVPAFQFLWSGHDVFLEHKRRYTLAQLEKTVRAAGLNVRAATYFFAAVFPLALLLRLPRKLFRLPLKVESDVQEHSRIVNACLYRLCRAEATFFRRNRWFGLTACVVAVPDSAQQQPVRKMAQPADEAPS